MTTAQNVFDIAMGLMDEINELTGQADAAQTREYRQRTLPILTALRGELYPYSDTYSPGAAGTRPVCPPIAGFDAPIGLDDVLCQTVMPYGLAAHLLLEENGAAASFFIQRYMELIARLGKGVPAESEDIANRYGAIGRNDMGYWG